MELGDYRWPNRAHTTANLSEPTVSARVPIPRWQRCANIKSRPCQRLTKQWRRPIEPASIDRCIHMDPTESTATAEQCTGQPTGPGPPIATAIACGHAFVHVPFEWRSWRRSRRHRLWWLCTECEPVWSSRGTKFELRQFSSESFAVQTTTAGRRRPSWPRRLCAVKSGRRWRTRSV